MSRPGLSAVSEIVQKERKSRLRVVVAKPKTCAYETWNCRAELGVGSFLIVKDVPGKRKILLEAVFFANNFILYFVSF